MDQLLGDLSDIPLSGVYLEQLSRFLGRFGYGRVHCDARRLCAGPLFVQRKAAGDVRISRHPNDPDVHWHGAVVHDDVQDAHLKQPVFVDAHLHGHADSILYGHHVRLFPTDTQRLGGSSDDGRLLPIERPVSRHRADHAPRNCGHVYFRLCPMLERADYGGPVH